MKAKNNIGIIKNLSRFLPLKTLDQMYKEFLFVPILTIVM